MVAHKYNTSLQLKSMGSLKIHHHTLTLMPFHSLGEYIASNLIFHCGLMKVTTGVATARVLA